MGELKIKYNSDKIEDVLLAMEVLRVSKKVFKTNCEATELGADFLNFYVMTSENRFTEKENEAKVKIRIAFDESDAINGSRKSA